ncbi:MAG: zf-HC2 domain-containing protein, partial [candidate division Zixibacteria bacterium]|nr:zf-HC2 domain-containing protein [candidate division Zixibacteria bacterium]
WRNIMRCQSVRYYLSAYCRDELPAGQRKAVAAHLQCCPQCHRQEAVFYELNGALSGLLKYKVSTDFNSQLLSRIAGGRYQGAHSKAYFPKRLPMFGWKRTIPVVATACFILAFVLSGGLRSFHHQNQPSSIAQEIGKANFNDSYMTIQPQNDRILAANSGTISIDTNWASRKQLDRANRIRGMMNSLASQQVGGSGQREMTGKFFPSWGAEIFFEVPFDGHSIMIIDSAPEIRMVGEIQQAY